MKTGYTVGDAMTEAAVTVAPDTTLQQCAKIMADKHVGALIVVEDKRPVGIMTEQDVVRKAVVKDIKPSATLAKDVMERHLLTVGPAEDIFEAITIMRDENIRHLPVIHEGKMVGLVTMKDILKIQPELFELLVEKFELREEERKPTALKAVEGNCDECGELSEELVKTAGRLLCPECRED
ncbi:CBS domain-containing protein [Candidatus Woesearchaeota archaeon]|nr:CBS domain-containing protein [Candidatus Woesearchaeota archaeon]